MLVAEEVGIRHRATHLLAAVMTTSKDISDQVVASQLFEVLMAISKVGGEENEGARTCAQSALEAAAKHGLVKPVTPTS